MKIDSHQHFWKYDLQKHTWIDDSMDIIRQDFLPKNLKPVLDQHQIEGCVAVQADQSEAETDFLVSLAHENNWIKGVVGWADLQAKNIEERLAYFARFDKLKGFRHIVQSETDHDFMQRPAFERGIKALTNHGFSYDILIFPHQIVSAQKLVQKFDNQLFIIDHLAKPYIKNKEINQWKTDIKALSKCPNVYCKISGMATETNWLSWQNQDLKPYLDTVVESFGMQRVMFGSDWPVCLLASTYERWVFLLEDYFKDFTITEQQDFWGNNALKFYRI